MRDDAIGQVFGVLIAGVITMSSVGAVLWSVSTDPVDPQPTRVAAREAAAQNLVSLLALQGTGWEADPDGVSARLGLMGSDGLDLAKLELLRGAMMEAAANGLLDYEDARASLLGPDAALDFHLRVYPAGLVRAIAEADLSNIRTAYIGDWDLVSVNIPYDEDDDALVAAANGAMNGSMVAETAYERTMMRDLGLAFTDRIHIGETRPEVLVGAANDPIQSLVDAATRAGDVYPDHKQFLDSVLPGRLAEYSILIVGSGVDQNTLTSNAVKGSIRDWVLDGGTLVVLGTDKQNYQWLRPIFDTGVNTVNGAPHAPDTAHPLLRVPNELDWPYYDNEDRAWDIDAADEDLFERVIVSGGDEVLAVSKEGSFGDGRVFLTTYEPRGIAATLGGDEAAALVNNIIIYADRDHLFLDYGPLVPDSVLAASAVTQTWVVDDDIGLVPMRIEVLVWRR